MSDPQRIRDFFHSMPDKFQKKRRLLVFTNYFYKPTQEKLKTGFRYFDCDLQALVDAFNRQDFDAIAQLKFAIDEHGDNDTSSVMLDLAYTHSGSMVAAQPLGFKDYLEHPEAPVLFLEDEQAKALLSTLNKLDQAH